MSTNLSGHHGRRERHVLRKALAGCGALTAAIALASAGATVAGAATLPHPARPSPAHLASYLRAALNDDDFSGDNVQIMNSGDGGAYYGLCLDAESDSGGNPSQDGDKVQLWTCNSGAPQQRWNILATPDAGVAGIVSQDGGLCLAAENDSGGNPSQNGDQVQLWTCDVNSPSQQWDISELSNGSYEIFNISGLILGAENDSANIPGDCGDPVQVQDYTGQSQQNWTLTGTAAQCY